MKTGLRRVFEFLLLCLFAALLLLCYSCDIQKAATKQKEDTGFKENIETKTFRKGDTVHYEIPNVIYKDTTIYRTNRQGTTIKTVYDQKGQLASIDCFASAIDEMRKENREFQNSLLNKTKEKKEDFDSTFIFYIMGGVVLIVFFALFLGYLYLKKNTAVVTQLLK